MLRSAFSAKWSGTIRRHRLWLPPQAEVEEERVDVPVAVSSPAAGFLDAPGGHTEEHLVGMATAIYAGDSGGGSWAGGIR